VSCNIMSRKDLVVKWRKGLGVCALCVKGGVRIGLWFSFGPTGSISSSMRNVSHKHADEWGRKDRLLAGAHTPNLSASPGLAVSYQVK
jgi:hypothetical protein